MRKRGAVGKMNGSAVERARGTWSTLPHLASPSISKHPFAVAMQLSELLSSSPFLYFIPLTFTLLAL